MAATASSRRILSLWCSRWAVELLCRRHRPDAAPLALIAPVQGVPRVVACGRSAEAAGVQPGMALADARAVVPGLRVFPDAPKRRAKALAGLAEWATRFIPWAATDGEDGLMLDVTGCAHLFGGEAALLDRLLAGLETLGFGGRAALSATAGAAWAVARFGGEAAAVVSEGGDRAALLPLPVAALRLPPTVVSGLGRLGLRTVGDLLALPRGPLADRFGPVLGDRIDRALGTAAEPVSPRRPVAPFLVQRAFADPILTPDSITAVLDDLLGELCAVLGARGRGVRPPRPPPVPGRPRPAHAFGRHRSRGARSPPSRAPVRRIPPHHRSRLRHRGHASGSGGDRRPAGAADRLLGAGGGRRRRRPRRRPGGQPPGCGRRPPLCRRRELLAGARRRRRGAAGIAGSAHLARPPASAAPVPHPRTDRSDGDAPRCAAGAVPLARPPPPRAPRRRARAPVS
ncbi:MAG: hypothetical protein CMM50_10495 [Rhodospirillaceae bacterium]|nr:hypothetical protein [Rhodospirillaceae bacterium]